MLDREIDRQREREEKKERKKGGGGCSVKIQNSIDITNRTESD